jgi:hypothetical protein
LLDDHARAGVQQDCVPVRPRAGDVVRPDRPARASTVFHNGRLPEFIPKSLCNYSSNWVDDAAWRVGHDELQWSRREPAAGLLRIARSRPE